jgi:hypothetical protein
MMLFIIHGNWMLTHRASYHNSDNEVDNIEKVLSKTLLVLILFKLLIKELLEAKNFP